MIFIGTRPEITKMAPIIRKASNYNNEVLLIHSGQHYDYEMSKQFLKELEIEKQVIENLKVGSGTHGIQTARMLERYEQVINKYNPDIVLALGDTNSVVAAGLICAKLNVPFGHIEAGIRSFDMTMPEEINRRVAGTVASIHFSPTKQAVLNLLYEGIDPHRIFLTGNTVVDATLEHAQISKQKSKIFRQLNIPKNKPLITLTFHRASNVDNEKNIRQICEALKQLHNFTIVFSVHPRTKNRLKKFNLESSLEEENHIILTKPLGYLDFLRLIQESDLILTDSGGIQEEAITLKKPCVTLRENTERPETVKLGVNFLVGTNANKIINTIRNKLAHIDAIEKKFETITNPFGDGKASIRILEIIQRRLKEDNLKFTSPKLYSKGSLDYRIIQTQESTSIAKIEQKMKGQITLIYDEKGFPKQIKDPVEKNWFVRIQY